MSSSEPASPEHMMADHVLGKIGVHAVGPDDPCGPGLHLHLSPLLLEPNGHIDFGVLGVFLDLASSQSGEMTPFVHADISINRIARPTGDKILIEATRLRSGRRTAIVHVAARDDHGTVVADSTQQVTFMSPPAGLVDQHSVDATERRRQFYSAFDGVCRLAGPLHDIIGIEESVGPAAAPCWTMPIGPASRNGFGGLHGGVAFDLVTEAAVGGMRASFGEADAKGALVRYLAPATVGPFRAVPTVMDQGDGSLYARVAVHDDGQDGRLCIVGEVHAHLHG